MIKREQNLTKYLAGWEVDFEDMEEAKRFLQTHAVDRKGFDFFKTVNFALELKMTKQGTIDCFEYQPGGYIKKKAEDIRLPDIDWEEHKLFFLKKSTVGQHAVGGEKPPGLELPYHPNLKTSFQYMGCIDGTDPYFQWVDTPELHILFPVYECNFGIYLDWNEPNHPVVLNPETFDPAWWDESVEGYENVVFESTRYVSTTEIDMKPFENAATPDDILVCGIPIWIQYPEIPVCPKTNETMKYVCAINSDNEIKIKSSCRVKNLPFSDEYLCFGDYGKLFVFYHPDSKIMHVNIQCG